MKKKKKWAWSPEEEKILAQEMAKSDVIATGIKMASKALGRSRSACYARWHTKLKGAEVSEPEPEPKSSPEKGRKGRWTAEEKATLLKCILEATTLTAGFKRTSELTGRSVYGCQLYWQQQLNSKEKEPIRVQKGILRTLWTPEEDRALLNQVTRHANNLSEGFRKAANLLEKTPKACEWRWYHKLSKQEESPICFATIGYKSKNINRKIVHALTTDNTETTTVKWWNKLLKFLKLSK